MINKTPCQTTTSPAKNTKTNGEQHYSGMAVNVAQDSDVTTEMVNDRTTALNNNPRNNK